MYSDRAFYDHGRKSWVNRDFGVFDNLYIYEREEREGSRAPAKSRFIWNEVPSKNMVKPAGEWNRYVITCTGNELKVAFNGEEVIDLDLSKSRLKDRPAEGYIGFQDETKPVWHRNVRIKELNPAATRGE